MDVLSSDRPAGRRKKRKKKANGQEARSTQPPLDLCKSCGRGFPHRKVETFKPHAVKALSQLRSEALRLAESADFTLTNACESNLQTTFNYVNDLTKTLDSLREKLKGAFDVKWVPEDRGM